VETQLKRCIAFARAPGAAQSSIRSATRMQCRRIILSGAATHGPRTVDQHAKEHPRWHPATSDWLAPDRRDDEPSHERQGNPTEEQSIHDAARNSARLRAMCWGAKISA